MRNQNGLLNAVFIGYDDDTSGPTGKRSTAVDDAAADADPRKDPTVISGAGLA